MSKITEVLDLQKIGIGQILTFGEACLPHEQFRAFKKLVLNLYHSDLKPKTIVILNGSDQVGAVPRRDNMGKNGGAPC